MGLTNAQYDAIMRQYSERETSNNRIRMARRAEISQKIPRIAELDSKMASISMEYITDALERHADSSPASLNLKLSSLIAEKKKLLQENGYPADYLEPVYTCPDCKDTGFIDGVKCHCFNKAAIEFFYARSNAKNIRKDENFKTFSLDKYSKNYRENPTGKSAYEHMKDVLKTAQDFAANFGKDGSLRNLILYGETGLGKTFLSNCIANELINSCHSVIYLTAIELFQAYSKSEFSNDNDTEDLSQEITDCDLLIIDDLGTELSNKFTNSRLFYCINDRILKDKSTIISTNLSMNQLHEQYSDRIFSRIMYSYRPVKFFGDNIRLQSLLK